MANPFPSSDPADDPLSLFGPESETPGTNPARETSEPAAPKPAAKNAEPATTPHKPVAEFKPARLRVEPPETSVGGAPADADGNVFYPTASVLERLAAAVPEPAAASRDLAVEVMGPPPAAGSVSFDRIASLKGLGFVDGVALIQTTCDAVIAAGESVGVPELHGLYLTVDGEVILHGPPTGEPPARELALLLHQLVAPNLMPPAGRLFVGRWINNDTPGLTEFASELAYFARPNSRELLAALHTRCESSRPPAQIHRLEPRHRPAPVPQPPPDTEARPESERLSPFRAWLKFHKPEVLVAFVVLIAVTTTAIATLLSNPKPPDPKPPIESDAVAQNATPPQEPGTNAIPQTGPPVITAPPVSGNSSRNDRNKGSGGSGGNKGSGGSGGAGSPGPTRRAAAIPPPPLGRRRATAGQPSTAAIESQNAARNLPPEGPTAVLPSRQAPNLTIYSPKDAGVEPPRLRSAEIPELLIAGFERRTNQVELVISERGEVQQVHMIGAPQRMPDVMLLSRAKELLFDPAIRNGVPVRYRLILSWNVTP